MKLAYPIFYRKYGLRLLSDFTAPRLHSMQELFLPTFSMLHFVTFDGIQEGPSNDEYLFRDIKKPIVVSNFFEIGDYLGNPRRVTVNEASLAREYFTAHKRMRPLKDLKAVQRDPGTLVVYNYSMIPKAYKYLRTPAVEYYKWHNQFSAVVKGIASAMEQSENIQYLIVQTPEVLPSWAQFNVVKSMTRNLTEKQLEVFNNPSSFLLLDLIRYIEGIPSTFDHLNKSKLQKLVFIFKDKGVWTAVNLGVLFSYIKREKEQDKLYTLNSKIRVEPEQMQKRVLVLLIRLIQSRTKTVLIEDEQSIQEPTEEEPASNEESEEDFDGQDNSKIKFEVNIPIEDTAIQEIDNDMDESQAIEIISEQDSLIEEELQGLNDVVQASEKKDQAPSVVKTVSDSLEAALMSYCDRLAEEGMISAGEYKRFERLSKVYKTEPFTKDGKTMEEFITIPPKDLLIEDKVEFKDQDTIADKSMLKSSLEQFDKQYIEKALDKHVVAMALNIQRAGVAISGYDIEDYADITGAYVAHTIKLTPIEGTPSTIRFKIPKIDEEGNFVSNQSRYKLRKQRVDMPIRKINSARVALTSYYGKTFINRGSKKQHDYASWLRSKVMEKILSSSSEDQTTFQDPIAISSFDKSLKAPRNFSIFSHCLKSVKYRGYHIHFSKEGMDSFPAAAKKYYEQNGNLLIGVNLSNTNIDGAEHYLIVDQNGIVYDVASQQDPKTLGSLEEFFGIDTADSPIDFCDVVITGKDIPVGIVLAYHFGLKRLIDILGVKPRRVLPGERLNLDKSEYAIQFSDETLVFSRENEKATLILAGFRDYHRATKLFSVYSFDKKGVYLNILETAKLGVRQIKELDLIFNMFVDPITKTLLDQMGEPETFEGLLFRAVELLMTDDHPDELDPEFMRIRGYERVAGAVYNELILSLRKHNSQLGKKNKPIEMKPYAVWKRITEDPAKSQISEINPVHALKEVEAVTYAGVGGRNKRSMTKNTRSFHPNDLGTISESTVDSSDVAINVFMSANPQLTSLLGLSRRYDIERDGPTSMLSTTALLSPGAVRDDPKRVNFAAIQASHGVACTGYHQSTLRTGYENIVAQRSGDLFAVIAKQPGIVDSIKPKGITVTYTDGSQKSYELGTRFGAAAGLVIPHEIVTNLSVGSQFEVGDAICYNSGHFEPDAFNPKTVCYKNNLNVKTVLWESYQTLEDASSISKRISTQLRTKTTKIKNIVIGFDQSVTMQVKPGDEVEFDSVLCYIEDSSTASSSLFNSDTIDTLKMLSTQAPRASVKGKVDKIEVYYYGEPEEATESIQKLIQASDKKFREDFKQMGKPQFTGSVDESFRMDGDALPMDSVCIRVLITSDNDFGVGDKAVFGNQLKTVVSEVLEDDYICEDGTVIDAVFGGRSVDARIVNSPYLIGTTNTLLRVITQKACEMYFS